MNSYDILRQVRGDTFAGISFELNTQASPSDPLVPISLVGATVKMQVRIEPDSATNLIEWISSNAAQITITGIDNNKINILAKRIPANAPAKKCVYDVQITFADGTIKTYIGGIFEILKDVTR